MIAIVSYIVLCGSSMFIPSGVDIDLQKKVQLKLSEGYELYGELSCSANKVNFACFQAMVKKKEVPYER